MALSASSRARMREYSRAPVRSRMARIRRGVPCRCGARWHRAPVGALPGYPLPWLAAAVGGFAFGQIIADVLAHLVALGAVVHHVVNDLEGGAQILAIVGHGLLDGRGLMGQHGSESGGRLEQLGGLAVDDRHVALFGGIRIVAVHQLQHFPFGDGIGGIGGSPSPAGWRARSSSGRSGCRGSRPPARWRHCRTGRWRFPDRDAGRIRRPRRRAAGWRYE